MSHLIRCLENLMSVFFYGAIFLILLSFAEPPMTARQIAVCSLILGFFAGIINNIERVLRELFDKNQQQ